MNYIFLLFSIQIVLILNNNTGKNGGVQCAHSTKTAYAKSFTKEQWQFINNPENYLIEDCM